MAKNWLIWLGKLERELNGLKKRSFEENKKLHEEIRQLKLKIKELKPVTVEG